MAPRQPQQPQRPQPRQQPQQNNPRMAAAMSVVQEDVPESLRDLVSKNEFAQKAMELLQSAGGQAAMNQPTPQPPTVAQRTDQRAAEGVAGLLQRLAPGMQQRGKQVQRAQARKMLGGGLPTQAAPNMARMANGGIVGYAEGGPTPGAVPPKAADPQDIKRLADLYRQAQASMDAATDPTAKADVQQRLNDLKTQMGDQLPFVMQYLDSTKGMIEPRTKMADGGTVKKYAGPDGSEVELDEDLIAAMLAENAQVTGYTGPSAAERRAALADEDARRAQEREARRAEQRTRQELANRGLTGQQINEILSRRLDAVEPGGIAELRQPQFDPRNPQIGPFAKEPTEYMPEGSSPLIVGGMGNPPTTSAADLLETLAQQTETAANVDTVDSPISRMLMDRLNAAPDNEGALAQATTLREAETKLAESAYDMSPEMKAAYAQRGTALDDYYAAMLDPERQRKAERRAVLSGLATPGGIARSGIAAGANLAEVRDMPIEARRAQAEEMFGLTKEQEDVAREGRVKAYEGGRGAFNTAFDRLSGQATQAIQTLGAMANSEQTRAQTERLANNKNQLDLTKARLDSLFEQGRLDEQSRATAVRLLDSQSRRLIDFRKQLADVLDTLGTPEEKAALMKENEGYIESQVEVVNAARAQLGMPAMPLTPTSTGSGGETGSTGDPELDELLQQY